jgi:hypothetical protein
MAEDITLSNITPAFFEKYVMSQTLGETYEERGFDPALVLGPTQNWKICHNSANNFSVTEIRPPYARKIPNELSMIIDWVDSNIKPVLIEFQDGSRIEALKLTPNPDSLIIGSSKIINRYNTMSRWVEEHWGDDLDSISFSGSTYSFNAQVKGNSYTGLTSVNRNYSEAYRLLKKVVDIYRTNGYLYQESNGYAISNAPTSEREQSDYAVVNRYLLQNPQAVNNHPRHGMIRERLYNRISFDYVTFLGYFESFDITDDSANPFKLIYSTVFKAEKTIWTIGK